MHSYENLCMGSLLFFNHFFKRWLAFYFAPIRVSEAKCCLGWGKKCLSGFQEGKGGAAVWEERAWEKHPLDEDLELAIPPLEQATTSILPNTVGNAEEVPHNFLNKTLLWLLLCSTSLWLFAGPLSAARPPSTSLPVSAFSLVCHQKSTHLIPRVCLGCSSIWYTGNGDPWITHCKTQALETVSRAQPLQIHSSITLLLWINFKVGCLWKNWGGWGVKKHLSK